VRIFRLFLHAIILRYVPLRINPILLHIPFLPLSQDCVEFYQLPAYPFPGFIIERPANPLGDGITSGRFKKAACARACR
jgi:hypothetical protein